jgi:peptide/nickel transport system substrate-binding protein/oligopeptide transport system substrate-binding protein
MKRRRPPLLVAIASLSVLLVTACHPGKSDSGTGSHIKSSPQSEITIGVGQTGNAISTLDPSQWGAQILIDQGTVMEGLYGYGSDGKLVPKIATKYKTSKDGRVWTFYLRKDAKWSNGKPVTANDFYYSWMRTASPKNANDALWASVMTYVNNAWTYHAGGVGEKEVGVKVINDYEIRLTLTSPHNILGAMAISGSMPLYGPSVDASPEKWFMPENFVGNGPYIVKSFVPNGKITLEKNPKYVGAPGQTNVGNIKTINVIPTPNVPVPDFLAKKLSAAVIQQPADYKYVMTHPDLKALLHSQADNIVTYLEWDKSVESSPLDDIKVRQAVGMAIKRKPIVENVLNGLGGVTSTFGFPGWPTNDMQHPLPEDLNKAKSLLAEAGYPGGKGMPTLYLYCRTAADDPTGIPVAEAIQQELKEGLGIQTKIVPQPSTIYGNITWGGINPDVHPGYVIGGGTPNWSDFTSLPIQANQQILFHGTQGTIEYRKHAANYYLPKYDPNDVAQLGNPDDKNAGTTQADWDKLDKAAKGYIAYLDKWTKQQPEEYQKVLVIPGAATNADQWANYTKAWKDAKKPADKHDAWVAAWKFVGNWSAGNGGANVGLSGQAWDNKHMSQDWHDAVMWNAELNAAIDQDKANELTANIDNYVLNNGYGVPLYYAKTFYLSQPGLTGIQANPWSWGGLFQLQYATWK